MTDTASKIRAGDARALARTATGIENRDPRAVETLHELAGFAGRATVVGITGPPGAGKSTLLDAIATALRRREKTLAILAVDPTSRATGGAILGDRIRMQQHYADPGIFIRSMATRGSLGGLSSATADLVRLMDAAGKDYVFVETVGVGQAEIEIANLAQVTVVVLVPGMGDDVQTIKAGIMEIADIFVINKADQPGAGRMEQELEAMIELSDGRPPAILKTVATTGEGVDELIEAISQYAPAPETIVSVRTIEDAMNLYERLSLGASARGAHGPMQRGGLHHLALVVPDLHAAATTLVAAGARMISGDPYVFLHVAPVGGLLLELIQERDSSGE